MQGFTTKLVAVRDQQPVILSWMRTTDRAAVDPTTVTIADTITVLTVAEETREGAATSEVCHPAHSLPVSACVSSRRNVEISRFPEQSRSSNSRCG